MRYVIDSDVVAAYLKGRPDAVSLLQRLLPDGLAISAISYGEIVEGIYHGTDPKRHQQTFQAFLRGVRVPEGCARSACR
jgi:predicted nucleic acid-binding protein